MTVSQQPVSIISDWPLEDEAVWKRIFTELAIGTPLHSRSLNGVPIFGNVATLKVFCAQSVPLCS